MANVLNQAQAEAVYGAMVALNNVGGLIDVRIYDVRNGQLIDVREAASGNVKVICLNGREDYENQNAFAAAYGMN